MELGNVIQSLNLEIQGGDDIDAPIVKTQLNFTFIDAPDHQDRKTKKCGAWEEFYSPDATHWKVLVFADGVQMWGGYITPDSYHETLTYRSGISFIARDNIGHLNDFPFDATGNAEGMISMYDLVQTAWRKIDSPMQLTTDSAKWLKCEDVSGIHTYMNVSAFAGKNWYEVLESTLYAYGMVMRYVGENKVAVYPLREMPFYGQDSISVANVVFETGAERELSPAARRIEETDEYDIEESLAQPLVDNEKNFTGEVESVSFTYLNTPVTSYFWKLNRTAEGTGWINGNAPAYFNPLAYAHASNVDSNDLKYLWLSSADGLASGFNGRCIQYSRYIEACDIKANIQFGSLYAFDNDLLRRALYTPSQLRVYYSVKIEQGGITNTLNDKGEWVSNTFVLNALTNERLLSIDIPKGDFTGEVLLTIRIYFIVNYGAVYCPIYSMTFTAVNAPLLTTNNINTNYNEKNNVILTRSPKIAPAMDKPFMVGVIKNGIYRKEGTRYFPTRLWSWNGNGKQQMAVYNHLQLLCYHARPFNILSGTIVNGNVSDFAKIYKWNNTEHIITSGVLNLISGFIENVQLREFVHYDTMWGDLTDAADFPPVDGGSKTTAESGAQSAQAATYSNTTEVNIGGGGGGTMVLDTYMSDSSTNGVQNKVIKAYVDSAVTDIEKELDILNEWKSLKESVLAKFTLDANGNVYLDGNLVVKGDTASGGSGDPSTNQGIDIEELKKYLDDNRYIDENELHGYGYATQTYVDTKTNTLSTALGNAISSKADKNSLASVATSGKYSDLSGLPTLGSLASKNSLAVADIPDLSSVYLPKSGGTMSGDIAMSVNTFLRDEVGNAMIGYNGTLVRVGNTARATDIKGSSVTINGNTPITSANISNQSVASAKSLVTSNSLTFADFTYSTVNIGAGTYSNYQTHIYGNAIRLRYGNNGEIGLILNSSGNITVGNTDVASTDYRFYVYGNMRVREQALVGSLKIGTPNDNFFANLKMDGSSLSIDKELKLLAGGTSDICPGIAASFKAKIAQIQNLVANNVIIGASSGTASNLAFNVQKYTSISSQAPAGLTTLFSIGTDGKATFNGDVVVNGNLIVSGDTSSGGSGNNIPASGIISIKVNGIAYEPTNGIVTLPDYPSSLAWSSISGKPTSLAGYGIIDGVTPTQLNTTLAGYMPTTGGTFSGEITAFNLAISNTGTGYHLQFKRGGGNIIWCPSGGYYRIVCNGAGTSDGDATLLIKSGTVSVKGNLSASGTVSQGSDIRFKDIIEHNTLKIEDIANAPCFSFKWNDRDDDSIHLGTSAQYWEDIAPELVSGSDFKTLNYASLGVAMGISLAKKAQNHEERIKMLEEENKALKAEIRRINNGICN